MIPLVDIHCHLLAGLDDGPRTDEEAVEMCRMSVSEGVAFISALAHQNDEYPSVTPQRIRESAAHLQQMLRAEGIGIATYPCAEIMAEPDLEASWNAGKFLSVADRKEFILLEMPHNLFVDIRSIVTGLREKNLRVILAHPERHSELLHDAGRIEELIEAGCLVQVSSGSITDPPSSQDERALKSWVKRGVVHFLGSDGHSPRRRAPRMAAAYQKVLRWGGNRLADRIGGTNGLALVQGLPLRVPLPEPKRLGWLPKFW